MFRIVVVCIGSFILFDTIGGDGADKHDKRILFNDPSFFEQRLSNLESTIQNQALKISSMETFIQKQTSQIALLEKQSVNISGVIFTRWGKMTCPNNTVTVHSGFAAGGSHDEKGGSPEYLCLTRDAAKGPVPGNIYINKIYGVEYETNFWKSNSQDEDVPCVVCQVPKHNTMMMLPGRDTCYSGWSLQYAGHLGSGYYDHPSNHDYACVDNDPDYLNGGEGRNTDGALFYPAVATCGTLQCPPYKDGHVILCAICTK